MRFVVFHSHFRPGGVRRVIESALPSLLQALRPPIDHLELLCGQEPDPEWRDALQSLVRPVRLSVTADPALGYLSEQSLTGNALRQRVRQRLATTFQDLGPENCIAWAHNLSLGRNFVAGRLFVHACVARGIPVVLHHHDWWFDNRWQRWAEMSGAGRTSLPEIARTLLAVAPNVRHAAINQADASVLDRHLPGRVAWLPNPAHSGPRPSDERRAMGSQWLRDAVGVPGPCWLLPCRLLRRKNIAEALLLTRWLRPEAVLVTTGGVSSRDEEPYARALRDAAHQNRWPLRLGVLHHATPPTPGVADLMSTSETVLLTSLIEGFGLPFLEAAAAERPLIARNLPNVSPDLRHFGFRFAHIYDEVLVHPGLFDWKKEHDRQAARFQRWRRDLPRACRAWVDTPPLLAARAPVAVPFSRLTLAAQLQVLETPVAESWEACAPLNPHLRAWQTAANRGQLESHGWPEVAPLNLHGAEYARRFRTLLEQQSPNPVAEGGEARAQEELIRGKLSSENLYPLLWSPEP